MNERARVLVVADEALRPLKLEEQLGRDGYFVVGPFRSVLGALRGISRQHIDAAVLDNDVRGELIFPLVDELAEKGIPFLFLTHPSSRIILEQYQNRCVVTKPFNPDAVLNALKAMVPITQS